MKALDAAGKALQLGALLAMPAAIWAGELRRDEAGAILIFVGSLAAFGAGMALRALASR